MTRRVAILALPQAVAGALPPWNDWDELAKVWNPFAEKMNRGVVDWKSWRKVVDAVERMDGRRCK